MENQSHSGYLSQTVLQPQQKGWHFKGHTIKICAHACDCVCVCVCVYKMKPSLTYNGFHFSRNVSLKTLLHSETFIFINTHHHQIAQGINDPTKGTLLQYLFEVAATHFQEDGSALHGILLITPSCTGIHY